MPEGVAEEVAELQAAGAKQEALHSSFGAEDRKVPSRPMVMVQ